MKIIKIFLSILVFSIILGSCSSIPKEERLAAVNEKKEQSALFLSQGHNEYGWKNYESSMTLYKSSFSLAASVDWGEGMIRSLVHLSRSADRIGESDKSLEYMDAAEELLKDIDNTTLLILVGNRKSEWLLFNESPQKAIEQSEVVIALIDSEKSEEVGESWRIQAAAYKRMKNYEKALESIENALSLDEEQHYVAELASDYYIRGSILSLSGREADAIDSMYLALQKDKFIENTPAIAQDLYALALIYEKSGQNENANHYFQRSYLVYKGVREEVPPVLVEKLKNGLNSPLLFQETDIF
ncbi:MULTISPECIES: tetratricopeptide repeat protein [unclassified Oceanispirochaeta]|uniref:tetratricopeptide repeat protein n=1 Tax=unclassified Oceanispirochaeta TaxID=2635722 RepID=UPI000E097371|nr:MULTISPECIES: tetratricopeptide repeat protein [unclassified Oceanispirochaeta]MBF9015556.1 hypothetical protein [Oceanispirochaeta sp. M2]NPD73955.1 hypothetical protein [Oceanispirochaeta sp. M1]RDG30265.1 hypothetical protein DV872_17815 [Oceanispirochaeta sp. M1]